MKVNRILACALALLSAWSLGSGVMLLSALRDVTAGGTHEQRLLYGIAGLFFVFVAGALADRVWRVWRAEKPAIGVPDWRILSAMLLSALGAFAWAPLGVVALALVTGGINWIGGLVLLLSLPLGYALYWGADRVSARCGK